jgi:predicted RNase H-like HicB family nuclease
MGSTVDEALQNAETALAEFVMALEEDGQAIPPPSAIEDVGDLEMVAYVTLKIPVTT